MPTRQKTRASVFGFIVLMVTAVAWATPVPDTGQTKYYNNTVEIPYPSAGQPFYGQDGNYSINPMSYTKLDGNGNDLPDSATSWVMVRDNVTGLIWEMKTNMDGFKYYNDPHDADNTYTWYDSNPATNGGYAGTPGSKDTEDFIKALNDAHYGGYSDWRLPTIKELNYIVNYGISSPGPTIDVRFFPNTASSWYWSSTTCAYYFYLNWFMYFYDGLGSSYDTYYDGYVRAVRGGQSGSFDTLGSGSIDVATAAADSYTDNGDGTVTDIFTGLMWQQTFSSTTVTWDQALAYCVGLNLGGHTDWRLPTIKELRSLVDFSLYEPSINTTYFPNTVESSFWSSTTNASDTLKAWGVGFSWGSAGSYYKDDYSHYYVRAVRGGQSGSLGNLVISPVSRAVAKDKGTTTFSVYNTGTGTMPWTATVTSGGSWLAITSGASGTDNGTITCSFTVNTSTSSRTATIQVTAASGATGSPIDVTVTQEPTPVPVLLVTPSNQTVSKDSEATTFSVSNTGTGTMPWTAVVTTGGSWLAITSGASGSNSGAINCSFTVNTSISSRIATIQVTASGATGSPIDVTVIQEPTISGCQATLDGNLLLHIPYLSYVMPILGTISVWADFNYVYNPTYPSLILFKYKDGDSIINSSLCATSTLSSDLKIHIPYLLLPDGVTHLWVDLEYITALSTDVNSYFLFTHYGVVSN